MTSQELLNYLNKAIARELQVSIQYMWQHVVAKGVKGAVVADELKKIAISEMKHAEAIAERLDYLGGVPTSQPSQINVGEKFEEMLNFDVKAEEEAITMYKEIIKLAENENDITTKTLFEGILSEEEDHHSYFKTILEND